MERKIYTHQRPDLDSRTAAWLLKKFGDAKLPGISNATIYYVSDASEIPKEEGIIAVDIGGGPFDHHPTSLNPDECATTLVAKALGINEDPALEKILKFVLSSDTKGGNNPFDIAYILKQMKDPQEATEWVCKALDAKYTEQLGFINQAKQAFANAQVDTIDTYRGEVRMVTTTTDAEDFSKYARFQGAGIVIQQRSTGNVQVFTNKRLGIKLYNVAALVRFTEMRTKGVPTIPELQIHDGNSILQLRKDRTLWNELTSEGVIIDAAEWYYDPRLEALLNGSLVAKNVPPTKIPLNRIQELVRIGLKRYSQTVA